MPVDSPALACHSLCAQLGLSRSGQLLEAPEPDCQLLPREGSQARTSQGVTVIPREALHMPVPHVDWCVERHAVISVLLGCKHA